MLNDEPIQTITDDMYCLFWVIHVMLILDKNPLSYDVLHNMIKKTNIINIIKELMSLTIQT
jgi:hypothetical protein